MPRIDCAAILLRRQRVLFVPVGLCVIVWLSLTSAASAEWSIGINFLGGGLGLSTGELAVEGTAGLTGFEQQHWNNIAPWPELEGRATRLADSNGRPTKADVSWKAPAVGYLDPLPDSNDERLMSGALMATPTGDIEVAIDDLPFHSFDVLLYYGGDRINLSALRGRIGAHLTALPFSGSYVSTTSTAQEAANVLGPEWVSGWRSIQFYASVHYEGSSAALSAIQLVGHPGDADGDHDVDAADLSELILGWTGMRPDPSFTAENIPAPLWSHGDFDGDYDVDSADLANLILHWTGSDTFPANTPPVSVPEPSGLFVGAIGAMEVWRKIRRRKSKTKEETGR